MTGQTIAGWVRAFARDGRANVAMIFAVAMVPIMIAAGVGLDFARESLTRSQMSDALDAAALAIGSTSGLSQDQVQALAQNYFNANYKGDTTNGMPVVSISDYDTTTGKVALGASYSLDTAVLKVAGITQVPVSASSTVVWGQSKLWVALVLDNSGSMASSGKMTALISASQQLLTSLKSVSSNPGDVQVGIVPFVSVVNVGEGKVNASWIDWSDWEAPPVVDNSPVGDGYTVPKTGLLFDAYGPGDDCPFTTTSSSGRNGTKVSQDKPFGYNCVRNSSNGASNVSTSTNNGNPVSPIPSSGNICPGVNSNAYSNDHLARYYNGCWSSDKVRGQTITVSSGSKATCGVFSSDNCSCAGKNGSTVCKTQRWQHTWVPNGHSSWGGCIMDRAQSYDIQNNQPSGNAGMSATNPASPAVCANATVMPLGYDWSSLNSQVRDMKANGSTNQAIGMAHGWQMLTPGDPYGTPTVPANTTRYIILLSDGLNTQDRWWGDGSRENTPDDANIDDRMNRTCSAAKADGIIIYSLYVNINNSDGNSAPLQNCASDSSKFFQLSSASQISTAFATIAQQITNLRVAK